ncbi:hypothetical protein N657DRAFT_643442 [Parathielavia appendiculata]|uniref:Zn(2)-C6 fungal-type domain-containing protein n=1 Tax=Parathielavia appendiculata TaxID=2587402 RepID=A0AAN6U6B3_9PEZI|nr:hypothetical protein N657DRAFT_643442 [Parathielavia appendiculata]
MAEPSSSNRSSIDPSSNDNSPSPSSSGAPTDAAKKRTRASKPKVRTGCITCKIRRVKCDEGKPACLRCTSTGRTCDGYDKAALARYRPSDPNQSAELAREEFVRACEWNEALRAMRRIEADIDETETEKRLFARFRVATTDGLATHLCNLTAFWRRLNPSTGCQDGPVKHAVVALAAAYELFQHPNESVIDGVSRGDLEVLTIQQYNRSIERLQSHAGSSALESIHVTLVCCLAFISLETLRGNHDVAVTHLANGLRILQTLPESAFDCLADGSLFVCPSDGDSLNMPDIIQLFAQLERSSCFFTHGIQPVISDHGYRVRRFDDGSSDSLFPNELRARIAMSCFQHDVMTRLHEMAVVTAGGTETTAVFRSDPAQQEQQACLLARSVRVGALVANFFSPARFGMPDPTTPELVNLYLDLLYFRCAQFLVSEASSRFGDPFAPYHHKTTPLPSTENPTPPDHPDHLLSSILHLANSLSTALSPLSFQPSARSLSTLHTHLAGPLYLVAINTPDPDTRSAAVGLLAESLYQHQHQHRDAPGSSAGSTSSQKRDALLSALRRVIDGAVDGEREKKQVGGGGGGGGLLAAELPRALTGGAGCFPVLWDGLVAAGFGRV